MRKNVESDQLNHSKCWNVKGNMKFWELIEEITYRNVIVEIFKKFLSFQILLKSNFLETYHAK